MAKGTLSIFVDESGIFKYPDPLSRFYILSLVLHDQSQDISRPLADLTNLLHEAFSSMRLPSAEFAQNVRPQNYKLFQVADLVCTVKLIEQKLDHGDPLSLSEERFFGGVRAFKRNVLRKLKRKEI